MVKISLLNDKQLFEALSVILEYNFQSDYYNNLLQDALDDEKSRVYIASDTGNVVGVSVVSLTEGDEVESFFYGDAPSIGSIIDYDDDHMFAFLRATYVTRPRLGEGIGTQFLNRREKFARNAGADSIIVEVQGYDSSIDARRLYDRAGYERIYESNSYWPAQLKADVKCSKCGLNCSCEGVIYYRSIESGPSG